MYNKHLVLKYEIVSKVHTFQPVCKITSESQVGFVIIGVSVQNIQTNVETPGSFKMSPFVLNQAMLRYIAVHSNLNIDYCDNLNSDTVILLVIVFGC